MPVLTKRLEVRVKEKEFAKLKEMAAKKKTSLAEVVREAVDTLYQELAKEDKKKALEDLASLRVKLPSWEKLEKEIEKGYEDK